MALAARTAASLILASLCLALAPAAQATHLTGWQDGGANLPATVDLADVSANPSSGVVIAVGKDNSTGDAVIFRRAGGQWVQDTFTQPTGVRGLVSVDLSEDTAWAVGTHSGGTEPLVLRIEGGETALEDGTTPAAWSVPATSLPAGTVPTAVAVRITDGMIATGTTTGVVYPFDDATGVGTAIAPPVATPAGPINAIALYDAGKAFTAGDVQPGGGPERIFKIDTSQPEASRMLPVGMGPSDPDYDLVGVGADSGTEAMAVEENPDGTNDPGLWSPTPTWTRDGSVVAFTTASKPSDLALETINAVVLRAVAGEHAGDGAVWRRNGAAVWSRDGSVSAEPLNGVAILGDRDLWAVGDDGAVKHYAPLPDPPPPEATIDSGPFGETTATTVSFGFSSPEAGATFECSMDGTAFTDCDSGETYSGLALGQHTFRVRAIGIGGTGTPAERIFTVVPQQSGSGGSGSSGLPVVQPPSGQCKSAPRPLLSNVVVRKRRGHLEIEFDAAVDVRVSARAYHGTALIGRTKQRVLKQGHHVLKLRYGARKGKPTNLKLLASPAAADACP